MNMKFWTPGLTVTLPGCMIFRKQQRLLGLFFLNCKREEAFKIVFLDNLASFNPSMSKFYYYPSGKYESYCVMHKKKCKKGKDIPAYSQNKKHNTTNQKV